MATILPFIPSEPFYSFSTSLDGTQYIFDVRWNGRAEQWFYDLKDEDGVAIRSGIRVALWSFSNRRIVDARAPTGLIMPAGPLDDFTEPTFDSLGVKVLVYYYTAAEVLAL